MAVFKYIVRNENEKEKGILTAYDRKEAEEVLRNRRVTILKLETVSSAITDSPYFALRERTVFERKYAWLLIRGGKVEQSLQQLAAMLSAGVPILNALQTVAGQCPHYLKRVYFCVANKLHDGHRLTETLQEEMPFLGQIVIGLIAAGEANGDIDKMCVYSADLMSKRRAIKSQVLQAMAYPALVILLTIGIVCFLMWKVIPKIMKFLSGRSGKLPAITQSLVDVTNFLQSYGHYLLLIPVFVTIAVILLRKNEETAFYVDRVALDIPLLGKAFRASANALWCRTLGILMKSGINIISALEFTEQSFSNMFYRRELIEMKNVVSQGHPLSTGLRVSEINRFAPLADSMILVGESTGRVDESLLKVAEFSEENLQQRISLLTKMIEPALFVIVGGIVGFVYIAFFMGLMAASTGGR
ncbi:MAG: type II secretion system F family protein [Victivallales bacterium]|nr:type II secretion system F family protein [Victivallales bacterium]